MGSALSFVNRMMENKPRYLAANPTTALRLEQIGALDPNYLAHKCSVSLVQDDAAIALARPHTDKLNHHLLGKALGAPIWLRWPAR